MLSKDNRGGAAKEAELYLGKSVTCAVPGTLAAQLPGLQ